MTDRDGDGVVCEQGQSQLQRIRHFQRHSGFSKHYRKSTLRMPGISDMEMVYCDSAEHQPVAAGVLTYMVLTLVVNLMTGGLPWG